MNGKNFRNKITQNEPARIAREYLQRGFCPIPIKRRSKEPSLKNWTTAKIAEQDLGSYFSADTNIGIVLGQQSGGLIDVDIDSDDALAFASEFLPDTGIVFGRISRPASHWIYLVDAQERIIKYETRDELLIELRGDGHQTVFPGSVHESGEDITFDKDGSPAKISLTALKSAVGRVAIATVVRRFWNKGQRHHLALNLSLALVSLGWIQEDIRKLINAVVEVAQDEEVYDRLKCVADAWQMPIEVQRAALIHLERFLSRDVVDLIQKCAGADPNSTPSLSSNVRYDDMDTDAGSAREFARHYDSKLLFCDHTNSWLKRKGDIYFPVSTTAVTGDVMEFIRLTLVTKRGNAGKLETRARIKATEELARPLMPVDHHTLDRDPSLLGMSNDKVFSLARNAYVTIGGAVITKRIGTEFDPNASCPTWDAFLSEIFVGDSELIRFVQRAVGYSLTGHVHEQCLFILIGTGANGKSTFLNVIAKLLGDYAGSTPMQCLMMQKSEQTNDLAALVGKRFVAASEGELNQKLAEAKIKMMTGGDKISCRRLYQEFFEYEPQFKLWLATNNLPRISGQDHGIWRRIRVIPFNHTVPPEKQDGTLPSKLAGELPGIFNWVLSGLDEWKSIKLDPPPKVVEATKEYRLENDTVEQFIDACCMKDRQSKASVRALYGAYVSWCEQNGAESLAKNIFGKTLRIKGFEQVKQRKGNSWSGLQLAVLFEDPTLVPKLPD